METTKRYGTPYQGSKNAIAKRIVDALPPGEVLVDAFCGGCAITHAALLSGKFGQIICNDLYPVAQQLFKNATEGKYRNETRWISREDFNRLKDTDPYVAICWSFGNNQEQYLYSKEIEPWKKAQHYACVFRDYSLVNEYDPRIKDIVDAETIYDRRMGFDKGSGIFIKLLKSAVMLKDLPFKWSPKFKPANTVALKSEINAFLKIGGKEEAGKMEGLQSFESLESLIRLQGLQRLESLQHIEYVQGMQYQPDLRNVKYSQTSYEELQIPDGAVVYCDPPYKGTAGYFGRSFDHERFYDWCVETAKRARVFISEYDMPADRFKPLESWSKSVLMSGREKGKCTERLFVPLNQNDHQPRQLSFF